MARSSRSSHAASSRRRSPRGGYGWFFLLLVIGGLLALVVFAPDSLRDSLGRADDFGLHDGQMSLNGSDPSIATEERSTALDHQAVDIDLTVTREMPTTEAIATPEIDPEDETGALITDRDRELIEQALRQARSDLESYRWEDARDRAEAILDYELTPGFVTQVRRIIQNAGTLEELFQRLDLRDELRRNHDSHPLLVRFDVSGDAMEAYPLLDMRSSEVPDTDNPVLWIESRLNSKGSVALQAVRGGSAEYRRDQIRNLRPADQARIQEEAQQALVEQASRVKSQPDLLHDPLAWYEMARFAYQNRIDDQVVQMLERAINLDPLLADTIKEDKATSLLLDMVRFREQGNDAGVNALMAQMNTQYRDTAVFPQAQAYYNQEIEQMRAARAARMERQREVMRERQQARLQAARHVQDDEAIARIQRDESTGEEAGLRPPASGSNGDAHDVMNRAMEIYARANSLPPSVERDQLYTQAIPLFTQARDLFQAAGDEENAVRANMFRFGSIKNRRAISR